MIDAVNLYAKALGMHLDGMDRFSTQSISCNSKSSENAWSTGESIYNQLLSVSYKALT